MYRSQFAIVTAIAASLSFAPTAGLADLTISSGATHDMSCSSGVCVPTAADAVLNYHYVQKALATGNLVVTTTGSGVQANNIFVKTPLTWPSSGTLTLDAYQSTWIDKSVSITGIAGLTLTTDDGGQNGTLSFDYNAHVSISNLSTALTINGAPYTLVLHTPLPKTPMATTRSQTTTTPVAMGSTRRHLLQAGLPNGFNSNTWAEDSNINGGLPYLIANPPPN